MAEQQGLAIAKQSSELYENHTCCRSVALTSKINEQPEDYINTNIYKNALDEIIGKYPDDPTYQKLKAAFQE